MTGGRLAGSLNRVNSCLLASCFRARAAAVSKEDWLEPASGWTRGAGRSVAERGVSLRAMGGGPGDAVDRVNSSLLAASFRARAAAESKAGESDGLERVEVAGAATAALWSSPEPVENRWPEL